MVDLSLKNWSSMQRQVFFRCVLLAAFLIVFTQLVNSLPFFPSLGTVTPLSSFDPGRRPIAFIPNAGQNDPIIHYQAHISGGNLFFSSNGLTFLASQGEAGQGSGSLDLNFVGANRASEITGGEIQSGVVNYILGDNPAQWQMGVPTFGLVRYDGLYPGISLIYQGQGSNITAVFQLEAGSDPAQISWQGAGFTPNLNQNGGLELASGQTLISLFPPQAWQEIDDKIVPVTAVYRLDETGRIGLSMGDYDPDRPLTVSLIQDFNSLGGGGANDEIRDLVVGPNGYIYLTGTTTNPLFLSANPYQAEFGGGYDGFVTVFAPDGQSLIYSTFLGGNSTDSPQSIALDNNGRIYVAGYTYSTNFPIANPLQAVSKGYIDSFITVLAADGQSLDFSTYLGGNNGDLALQIALDGNGRVGVVGFTDSEDFFLANPYQSTFSGGFNDAFITVIDSNGWAPIYSTYLGRNLNDTAWGALIDDSGRVFVTGHTDSANFPLVNPFQSVKSDGDDAFLTVFAPDGQSLEYSTYLGGNDDDWSNDVAVDENGRIYLTGHTSSTDFPMANPLQPVNNGITDVFLTVLDPNGQSLIYSTYLGGVDSDLYPKIALGDNNRVYLAGSTQSINFPLINPFQPTRQGLSDQFITILSSDGQNMDYSTYLGGNADEDGLSIDLDSDGRIFVAGLTTSPDFPVLNPYQSTYGGQSDGYLTLFAPDGQSLEFSTYVRGDFKPTSVGLADFEALDSGKNAWLWFVGGTLLFGIFLWIVRRQLYRHL